MQKQLYKAVSLILAILLLMSTTVTAASPSDFSDFPTDWSAEAMTAAVVNNILHGFGDGRLGPNETLKRAEMAAIINRILGAVISKDISGVFTDVRTTDWYYQDIARAVNAGTLNGVSDTQMNPNDEIRREDAILILSRILLLAEEDLSPLDRFSDKADIDSWAVNGVAGMVKAGFVNGYENGKLLPRGSITRAEFAQILHNILKKYIIQEGTYTEVPEKGSVVINVPGVTLKGVTIDGDLIIGDGVGTGTLTLEDVTIKGRIIFRGAGSVTLKYVTVEGKIIINNVNNIVKFNNYKSDKVFKNIEYITDATFLKEEPSGGGGGGGTLPPSSKATYKVKYYQQNADDNNYTEVESDTYSANIGTLVSAAIKTYAGFTENTTHPDRLITGTVVAGGSLVLKVFYNRNVYTAAFNSDGGSAVSSQSVKYGALITRPTAPTKTGYVFNGWFNGTIEWNFTSDRMPMGNITLTAKWVPSSSVTYKVEHYWQNADDDNYVLYETKSYTDGTTGQTVTAQTMSYAGLTLVTTPETVASGTVLADGSLTLKLYYDRILYPVTFDSDGGTAVTSQNVRFGAKIVKPADPTKPGFSLDGWYNGDTLWDFTTDTMPSNQLTLKAKWLPASTISYEVEHYWQNADDDNYTLHETKLYTDGITNQTVTAVPQVYTGFYHNPAAPGTVSSGVIPASGTLTLKLYYDRETYDVKFYDGADLVGSSVKRYGQKVVLPAEPSKPLLAFAGWYLADNVTVITADTVVTGAINAYAKWTDDYYTVSFYDYDTKVDEKKVAKNGTLSSLSDKIFTKTTISGKDYVRYAVWVDQNNVVFTTSTAVTSDMNLYSKFKTVGFETYIERYDHSFKPATIYDGNTRAADAIKLMIFENESYSLTAFSQLKTKVEDKIYDKNVIDSDYNILLQENKRNPVDDLLLPKYNTALNKLNELKAQYNVSNQAFDDLVDLLSPDNLLIHFGPETETLSGYKLKNEADYYQILKQAVLLADTAGVEFAQNYSEGTRREYLDKALDRFFDYLNTINKYVDRITDKFAPSYTSKDLTEEQILARKSLMLKIILEDADITVDEMFEKYFDGVDGKNKKFKGVFGEVARWLDGDIPS